MTTHAHPTTPPTKGDPRLAKPPYPGVGVGTTPFGRRLTAGFVTAATGTVLGVAAYLKPAEAGVGTHSQLNLPPCSWVINFNLPCPTCGMTTSFAHAADGNLLQSFLTQPAGFILAILTAAAFLISLYVLFTGSTIVSLYARLWGRSVIWLGAVILISAWAYKILVFREVI